MILDATGAEQIRDAFTTAAGSAGEHADDVDEIAGALTEAADEYEGRGMAASTIDHLRAAAASTTAARTSLGAAAERLQATLGDFNTRDGLVAEAVAAAGNLMQACGYAAAFTVPGTAPAGPSAALPGPGPGPGPGQESASMSPRDYLDAVQDIQDGARWLSMCEGNPRWRPSDPTPELAAQLAADDKGEDDGMDPDDRQTCYTHQSWLADCIGDPSHSNPGTRDKPGSSFNWCTVHRAPVQVCQCWPATLDGQPPATTAGGGESAAADPLAGWRGSYRMSPKPVSAAWTMGDDEFRQLVAAGLPEGPSLQQRAGEHSPWTDVTILAADSCDHRNGVCVDCAVRWQRRLDLQIVEQRPAYEVPQAPGADESYSFGGDTDDGKPPYWVRRDGRTVVSQSLGEPVSTTEYPDLDAARAGFAEQSCDPGGAGAPAVDDEITVHWGDRAGQNLRVSAVTGGPGRADYVVEAQPTGGGPRFSLTLVFGQYQVVRRPAAS